MKTKLQRKRIEWKRSDYVPAIAPSNEDINDRRLEKVEIVCRSYVCPWCNKKYEYFLANGQIIHGCGSSYQYGMETCGSRGCNQKRERYAKRK